ncbi:response regulator [Alkalinema sp. FACHB-956]|nr:response regulator [Alkalinema sp. FACHB-956]
MPDVDGITLCRQLRTTGNQTPILMLTAKNSPYDRVAGLDAGADDYLSKPFHEAELLARIRALLRRQQASKPSLLQWERLQVDVDDRTVLYDSVPIHLTPKEYGILEMLLQFPRRIFSRSAILDQVWGLDTVSGERAVNTQIGGLRQKLRAAGISFELIESVYGLGYRLLPPPSPSDPPSEPSVPAEGGSSRSKPARRSQKTPAPARPSVEAEIQAKMAQAWAMFQETLPPRLAQLERAIAQWSQGTLTLEVRQQAQAEAHRLIGSFGSLGFPQGSELARSLETALQSDRPCDATLAQQVSETLQTLEQQLAAYTARLNQDTYAGTQPQLPLASPTGETILAIMTQDRQLLTTIEHFSPLSAWQTVLVANLSDIHQLLKQQLPLVSILDFAMAPEAEAIQVLNTLTSQRVPVVILLDQDASLQSPIDRLQQRVYLTRLGARAIVSRPIEPAMLLKSLTQAIEATPDPDAQILLVDDDPQVLATIATLLEPWALQVTPLENPKYFWEILNTCNPDLLILDIELPEISGFDLCRVVRSDPDWVDLPIIFLSAHTDRATVTQVFSLGADDYVRKPIVEPELIARILNRLRRSPSRDRYP